MSAVAIQASSIPPQSAARPRRVLLLHEDMEFGGDFDLSFKAGLEQQGC
jgi:hypothetical protein